VLVAPGVVVVGLDAEIAFLHAHPVRALPGVGPRTEQRLGRFGVSTIGDLAAVPRESLERLLGTSHGSGLHALAHGFDARGVAPERATQSIGHEETFATDLHDPVELARRARSMAAAVADRCREAGVEARTVTVKVRFADFSTHTRSRTLASASAAGSVLAEAAAELLLGVGRSAAVRLLGVHASSLAEPGSAPEQLELFAGERAGSNAARPSLDDVTDTVRARFGAGSIAPASALSRPAELRDDVGRLGVVRTGAERR
jgi:DNA polymerase-4